MAESRGISRKWKVGERAVWPRVVAGCGLRPRRADYIHGTVVSVDLPGLPPGVQLQFDHVDPVSGLDTCYATHYELQPE